MAKSLYQAVGELVDPVTELLKASEEVNYHLRRAGEMGWTAELVVSPSGELSVRLSSEALSAIKLDGEASQ